MRRSLPVLVLSTLALLAAALLGACNTVHGIGEDARSVGRVFSDHPNGERRSR